MVGRIRRANGRPGQPYPGVVLRILTFRKPSENLTQLGSFDLAPCPLASRGQPMGTSRPADSFPVANVYSAGPWYTNHGGDACGDL
jgi:hypothetical protein